MHEVHIELFGFRIMEKAIPANIQFEYLSIRTLASQNRAKSSFEYHNAFATI